MPFWLLGGIVFAVAAKILALAFGSSIGAYTITAPEAAPEIAPALLVVLLAMISTFVPSFAEDIITRGFWWRVTGDKLRGLTFVLATSAIYVLNHVYRLEKGPVEWLMLFCFGIAYGLAMMRTGSLWAAVGVHWGWNLSNALLDAFATVEVGYETTPLISAGAHLLMAAVLLTVPKSLLQPDRAEMHEHRTHRR